MTYRLNGKISGMIGGAVCLLLCFGCAAPGPKTETPNALREEKAPKSPEPPSPPQKVEPAPRPEPVPQSRAIPPGPQPAPAPQEVEKPETYLTHTVKYSGETVSIIAAWYLGDMMKWETLAEANPQINPKIIRVGDKILVPESLLVTRDPMPKEFVDKFYPPKTPSQVRPPTVKPKPEESKKPDLFGPK